jgi:diguanylate cyclase (GGDEF)-like protein/PAS domain S-box-containing protein
MKDQSNTKQALIAELASLKHRIAELEQADLEYKLLNDVASLHNEILTNMMEGVLLTRVEDGTIVYVNRRFESMFGYNAGELVGKPVSILNAPSETTPDAVAKDIMKSLKWEGVWNGEVHNISKDGVSFWCYAHVSTFKHSQYGNVWIAVHQDITKRKRAEAELRMLASRNETILAAVPDIIMEVDGCKRYTWANKAGMQFFGEDVIGREASYYFEGEQETYNKVKPLFNGSEDIIYIESWQRRQDGEKRLLSWWCKVLKNEQGFVAGALSTARDITELKQAEEALFESEERYRTLVDNASDIVFKTDNTGHFTFVNPAGIRIIGYKEEEIIGRHYPTLIRSDKREEATKFFGIQFVKGVPNTYSEYPVITKGGAELWLGQNTKLIVQNGHIEGFQAIARDITARKQAEEELRRNQDIAERLAQEMAIIAEIGKVIGSTLDIEEAYESFVVEVQKLIPIDSLTVNLYDFQGKTMHVAYTSGLNIDGRRQGDPIVLEGSLSESVIRARTSRRIQPASIDEIVGQFPRLSPIFQAGLRSIMCVPLFYRDEVIGVLHFRSRKPHAYTEQDLRLAERIGMQIAGAIANSQLYADLKKTGHELKESEQRYRELSIVDGLTQLYNSRHFYFQLKIEIDRSNRYGHALTLLLLDLDNFKHFNDTYGHVEGDQVLMRLGQVVKRCLRETDFAYRYGGEEFTILLPTTTNEDGAVTAERIRTEFKKETFFPAPSQDVHKTVSIGLAQYKPQEDVKAFVQRVDQLMYQAKKDGKDRVCSES